MMGIASYVYILVQCKSGQLELIKGGGISTKPVGRVYDTLKSAKAASSRIMGENIIVRINLEDGEVIV